MRSEITTSVIRTLQPQQSYVSIPHTGIRFPVISTLRDVELNLANAAQCCIIREEMMILIWLDNPGEILQIGAEIEKDLLSLVRNKSNHVD